MRFASLCATALIVLFATSAEALEAWGSLLALDGQGDPRTNPDGMTITLHTAVDRAADLIDDSYTEQSDVEATVRFMLGVLDMNVKPRSTEVWVDGTFRGTCDAFDGHPKKLHLRPGTHRIKLVTPDGLEVAREIRVRAGIEFNVGIDLRS